MSGCNLSCYLRKWACETNGAQPLNLHLAMADMADTHVLSLLQILPTRLILSKLASSRSSNSAIVLCTRHYGQHGKPIYAIPTPRITLVAINYKFPSVI